MTTYPLEALIELVPYHPHSVLCHRQYLWDGNDDLTLYRRPCSPSGVPYQIKRVHGWPGMAVQPHRTEKGTAGLTEVALTSVWHGLKCGKWISRVALKEASGTDDDSLTCIINFLTRWEFVDVKPFPELLVRRKPGSFSPMEIYGVLRRLADQSAPPTSRSRIAERVACRACNSRELNFVGPNEVECTRCHEKQWYAIDAETGTERKTPMPLRFLNEISRRLGPQRYRDIVV